MPEWKPRPSEVVLDRFPPCVACGWAGYPRYSSGFGDFARMPSSRMAGEFYVTTTACQQCGRRFRMYRRVDRADWVHDVEVTA